MLPATHPPGRKDGTPSRAGYMTLGALAAGAWVAATHARARQAEQRHPPLGDFVDAGMARLHYVERGRGPQTVVLIHGNGSMVQDFLSSGVVDLLARDHRVIVIDRPGYGYSSRPHGLPWTAGLQARAVREGLRRLGVRRPILVGHSWGTLVALNIALDHPGEVAGVLLMSGYYFPEMRADIPVFGGPAIPGIGDLMRYTLSPMLGRAIAPKLIKRLFAPRQVPRAFKEQFPVSLALRPWQIRASAQDTLAMLPGAAALRSRLPGMAVPTTILSGSDDGVVDLARHARRLQQTIPGSRLELVPGAGHMVHHAAPGLVAELVGDLARVEAESRHAQVAA